MSLYASFLFQHLVFLLFFVEVLDNACNVLKLFFPKIDMKQNHKKGKKNSEAWNHSNWDQKNKLQESSKNIL